MLASTLTAGTLNAAQSAPPEPEGSPLKLSAPTEVHAYHYRNRAEFDAGIRLVAPGSAVEVWSKRPSYNDEIQMEIRFGGETIQLPEGLVKDFRGLPNFLKIYARDAGGALQGQSSHDVCLNGQSERTNPEAPIRSPYPWGCPYNKFTQGSVQGIQSGWATRLDV